MEINLIKLISLCNMVHFCNNLTPSEFMTDQGIKKKNHTDKCF